MNQKYELLNEPQLEKVIRWISETTSQFFYIFLITLLLVGNRTLFIGNHPIWFHLLFISILAIIINLISQKKRDLYLSAEINYKFALIFIVVVILMLS